MTVNELIKLLMDFADEHGNLEVVDEEDEPIKYPEECEGVCVLAQKA